MKRFYKIIMGLLIICSASSFFLSAYINQGIQNATITQELWEWRQALPFRQSGVKILDALHEDNNDIAWQHFARLLANHNKNIAFELGMYFYRHSQIKQSEIWFRQAIRLGHKRARLALAQSYFTRQFYNEIDHLLLPILDIPEALLLRVKLAVMMGDLPFIKHAKSRLLQQKSYDFYRKLVYFNVISTPSDSVNNDAERKQVESNDYTNKLPADLPNQCLVDMQLFATELIGLERLDVLRDEFQQHKLHSYICLNRPQYIPAHMLDCQFNPSDRIQCDARVWQTQKVTSRFITLMVKQGGANVQQGILYLDLADDVNVFAHEISHLLGFIDEYALPANHLKCASNQDEPFAHNISVIRSTYQGEREKVRQRVLKQLSWGALIKSTTPILTKGEHNWIVGTPVSHQNEIGVFKALTCEKNTKLQAYKPMLNRTQLQYYETEFPASYLDIFELSPRRFLMPSYHYNVSESLVENGDVEQAREVLKQIKFD